TYTEERAMSARRVAAYGAALVGVFLLGTAAMRGAFSTDNVVSPQSGPASPNLQPGPGPESHPAELLKLADDFRGVRRPRSAGVVDYAALVTKQKAALPG